MHKRGIVVAFFAVLLLGLPVHAFAALVKLVQTSGTTYSVNYETFNNVAGVLLIIKYDPETASVSGASQGAAVTSAAAQYSTGMPAPGELRIGVAGLNALPVSGTLATITFTPKAGAVPRLLAAEAQLSSTSMKALPKAAIQVFESAAANPGGTGGTGSTTGTGGTGTGGSSGGTATGGSTGSTAGTGSSTGTGTGISGGVGGAWRATSAAEAITTTPQATVTTGTSAGTTTVAGTVTTANATAGNVTSGSVTPPTDLTTPSEKDAPAPIGADLQTVGLEKGESSGKTPADKGDKEKPESKSIRHGGIIERFKEFDGEASSENFIGLFVDPVEPLIQQDPAIAYLDSKIPFKLKVHVSLLVSSSPTFLLKGASMLDLASDGENWLIEAQPKDKAQVISLVILDGGERTVELPLLVVPKIPLLLTKEGKVDPLQFSELIKDRGVVKSPRFDFNADGKHDYHDDFIFTANYLRQSGIKAVKPKKEAVKVKKVLPAEEGKQPKTAEKPQAAETQKPAKNQPAPKSEKKVTK